MKPKANNIFGKSEREQLERYRNLARISTDWFWETDEEYVITYISDSVMRITGLPKEAYIGKSRYELASEETKQTADWKQHIKQVARHEPIKKFEYKHVGPNGKTIVVRVNATPLFHDDGRFRGYLGSTMDITELVLANKRTEEVNAQLKEREFLKFALDEHAIVSTTDNKGNITYDNDKFCDISGYTKEELLGQNHRILKSGEHSPEFYDDLWLTITNGKTWHGEIKNEKKEGGDYWVVASIVPFLNAQGKPFQYASIRTDITERKVLEDRFKESEERFRDTAEASGDWIWETGPDLRYTRVSDRFYEDTGRTPDQIIGMTRFEFAGPETIALAPETWRVHEEDLLNHRPFRDFEYPRINENGEVGYVRVSGKPYFNKGGQFLGFRGAATDITMKKTYEAEFIKTAAELQEILSTTSQGYWRIDNDTKTIGINPRMSEILGVSESDAIGTEVRDYLNDEQRGIHKQKLEERKSGKSEAYELMLTSTAGKQIPCLFSATPLFDKAGKKIGSFALVSDITEYKEHQFSLEKTMHKAEVANRAKSELMANMSHELRTPLNAIIGFSSAIQEEIFGPLGNDKYIEYLGDIHNSGQHLLELINDILDLSAFEEGALELSETNIDVLKIVESMIRIIQPRAEHGNVKVTSSIMAETPQIYADERRVKQVFLNLLSNAVKFTPEGGKVIVDSTLNADGSLSVFVGDTGYGMSDDESAIAMSKFGQVDSGHDRKHEGSGLGLPLTKGLMELHGGTLEIDSLEGYGTMVTATFPQERIVQNVRLGS